MKKLILTQEVMNDLITLYELAERYIGAKSNIVQPVWARICKAVTEEIAQSPPEETKKDG